MSTAAETAPNGSKQKLTFKEKLSYAMGQMPGTFYGSFTGQIQAFWYTWMGLGIKYIIIAQILYGIWNLVNDPIFGVLQDRTRSKDGRYIPWIKWFSPLFTVAFIILFLPPQLWRYGTGGEQYQLSLFAWYLLSQMFYDTFFTIVYLAHVSLLPQMTMDQDERTEISILSSITGVIGIAGSAIFPLIYLTNPTEEKIASFQIVVIIIGCVALLPWIFIIKNVKERQEFIPPKETPFVESVKCVFKNPSGRIYMIYDGISVGLLNGAMTAITFLMAWVFGLNEDYNPGWGIVDLLPYLVPVVLCFGIGIWIELQIPKKWDVKAALMYSMICEAIGFGLAYIGVITSSNLNPDTFVVPSNLWMVSLGMSIAMLGFSGDFIYHNVMRADTIDYDEFMTGERRESVYAGVGCLLSKPMISVALAVVPGIIAAYGLVPVSPDDPQTALKVTQGFDQAVIGVATAGFLFTAILAIIGVISWFWYPLDRKALIELRANLEKIHAQKRDERLGADGLSKYAIKDK
jgi:GPH family glycoside/pentoside/hexuronide:cation symporter